MAFARYFVSPVGKSWLVTLEGSTMGAYASRTEAVDAACVMADLMGAMHHEADVMLEAEPGEAIEVVWTYGIDKLPARRARAPAVPETPQHVRRVQRGEMAA